MPVEQLTALPVTGLEKALLYAGGTHTIGDVADAIERGDCKLWVEEGAAIVTQLVDEPRKRVVHFWLAAGELEPVVALSNKIIEWAKENGCVRATLAGRKGWVKALAPEGWKEELVLMGREV